MNEARLGTARTFFPTSKRVHQKSRQMNPISSHWESKIRWELSSKKSLSAHKRSCSISWGPFRLERHQLGARCKLVKSTKVRKQTAQLVLQEHSLMDAILLSTLMRGKNLFLSLVHVCSIYIISQCLCEEFLQVKYNCSPACGWGVIAYLPWLKILWF